MSDDLLETNNSKWDIFQRTIRDSSTVDRQYIEYYEQSPTIPAGSTKTSWRIQVRDIDQFVDMSSAYIQLQFQIRDNAGGPITGGANIAPCNSGYSMFSQFFLRANGQLVEQITQGSVAYNNIMGFLLNSKDFSQTSSELEFWYPDELPDIDGYIPGAACETPAPVANSALPVNAGGVSAACCEFVTNAGALTARTPLFNRGHYKRWLATKNSRSVTLMLPLRKVFGYLDDVQTVTRGIQWEVELHKNDDNNVLYTTKTTPTYGKIVFERLSIWVPNLKPSITVLGTIEKQLAEGISVRQRWLSREVFGSQQYDADNTAVNWLIQTSSRIPELVVVVGQDLRRYGSQAVGAGAGLSYVQNALCNHSNFDSLRITRAQLRVGGAALYPREAYTDLEWGNGKYSRVYQQFLECAGIDISNEIGAATGYQAFGQLHPMFCFDLRAHEQGPFDQARTTDIRFEATLAPAGTEEPDPTVRLLPLINGGNVYPLAQRGNYMFYAVVFSPRELEMIGSGGRLDMKL